ncbi:MAG: phosphoglycerate kinase [Gammaproteobacteria bacterium]|nr:phosphoglycerate kinase [Gammaproteobacteria bacterium]
MSFQRMTELDLANKRVLIREDLNVPLADGEVSNDKRIRAALPTLELALQSAAQLIVMSHLGRPKEGIAIEQQQEFSMAPVARHLGQLLGRDVPVVSGYLENPKAIGSDKLVILENVRINTGEKANDLALAAAYAELCDVFVMDAFGTAHRAQASTHGVAEQANEACAGPLLAGELDALERSLASPKRPMLAIVGGAKVSTKLEVLNNLAGIVDQLIVGGGIANTFLLAAGANVGQSLCEPDLIETATSLMAKTSIPLPTDVVVAKSFGAEAEATIKPVADITDDDMILDIGPESAEKLAAMIAGMKTIIWNGPLGVFEFDSFAAGTQRIARAIAENAGFSLAGGGETVAAIDKFGITDSVSYISTGGGAFLEYVQGIELPAVAVLNARTKQ